MSSAPTTWRWLAACFWLQTASPRGMLEWRLVKKLSSPAPPKAWRGRNVAGRFSRDGATITALKLTSFLHSSCLRVKQKSWQRWIFKVPGLEFEVQQVENNIRDAGARVYTAAERAKPHDQVREAAAAAIKQQKKTCFVLLFHYYCCLWAAAHQGLCWSVVIWTEMLKIGRSSPSTLFGSRYSGWREHQSGNDLLHRDFPSFWCSEVMSSQITSGRT